MKIETKLETNQPVFMLFNNKILEPVIESISIAVDIHERVKISYWIKENPAGSEYNRCFNEDDLHATKELLVNSL